MAIKDVAHSLRYNEQKIEQARARALLAENFAKDLEYLTQKDKLFHFDRLASLNERSQLKGFHITLNFVPGEHLTDGQMKNIAREFMQKAGLGRQPYLVYRHQDTAHEHMHILSSRIQQDGKVIGNHPDWFFQCQEICRTIEQSHQLKQKTALSDKSPDPPLQYAPKVEYGKMETVKSIARVLKFVLQNYHAQDLESFNSILRLYNVKACAVKGDDPAGPPRGISYIALNDRGQQTSLPINASGFEPKATLRHLEPIFEANRQLFLQQHDRWSFHITRHIDLALEQGAADLTALNDKLQEKGIDMVLTHDRKRQLKDVSFVDHDKGAVFRGDQLGERFTALALLDRCTLNQQQLKPAPRQEQNMRLRPGASLH